MREPAFWYVQDLRAREAAPLVRTLLWPCGALYSYFGTRRLEKTTPKQVDARVFCIGNLTLGGAGKTPIARALRSRLTQKGLRSATLSRGYRGRLSGPLRVAPETHTAADVGDEPLMLASDGEAWISKDRAAGAAAMVADGVEVILLDDGHQNPTLVKDLSIVVVDADRGFGNRHVFPAGPLREPVDQGLARADGVIVMGEGPVPKAVSTGAGPVLRAALQPLGPPPPGPLIAFAGIGQPERFFNALLTHGANLIDEAPYPDHHRLSDRELNWLRTRARREGAALITTEKDFARLTPAQRADIVPWPVSVAFEDELALDALLEQSVG